MIFKLEQALAQPQGAPLATEAAVERWQALAATDRHGPAFLPPTRGTVYGTLLNHRDALAALGDEVNAALQEQLRDVDIVARLGGDEFAVLARGLSVEVARSMVQRLHAGRAAALVGASVGLAMRRDHASLSEALAAADALMYENKQLRRQPRDAKHSGRSGVTR